MPIPRTRADLIAEVERTHGKLVAELDEAGPTLGARPCVDGWSVKDLLAMRAWWSEHVVEWIDAGRRGESPVVPAEGYRWRDTPELNASVVRGTRRQSCRGVRARLDKAHERVRQVIDELSDRELLEAGVFGWAGKCPLARWISMNTTRQYATARTLIRRAIREQ